MTLGYGEIAKSSTQRVKAYIIKATSNIDISKTYELIHEGKVLLRDIKSGPLYMTDYRNNKWCELVPAWFSELETEMKKAEEIIEKLSQDYMKYAYGEDK